MRQFVYCKADTQNTLIVGQGFRGREYVKASKPSSAAGFVCPLRWANLPRTLIRARGLCEEVIKLASGLLR